jgi:hyaluronate lyase
MNSPLNAHAVLWRPAGSASPTTLAPIADAYVRAGVSASTNFGAEPTLYAKKGISPDQTRRSYLKFDLAGIRTFKRATLRVYGCVTNAGTNAVITTVYAVQDTAWDEHTVTWNTRPDLGAVLGRLTVAGVAPRALEINVTEFVREARAARRDVIAFAITSVDHTSAAASFTSREAATAQPQLVIER